MTNVFDKDPNADLDYQWDWGTWLADGETIVSAEITTPDDLTMHDKIIGDKTVTAWFSGGVAGKGYKITCHMSSSNTPPRTDDRSIYFRCRER